ncbi:MAG TPA: hypothetical protein PLV92_28495, partial [Pirellulaceae bacterium]|nr:hypothetical protein [Pirellulaceae bacterium]
MPWENDPTIYHDLKVERPMALRVEYSSQAVLEGLEAQLKAVSRRSKNRTELTRFRSDSDWQRAPKMSFSSSDKASKQQGTPGDGFETLAPYSFDAPAPDSAPAPAPGQSGKAATDADENGTAGSTPSKDATPANESPTPAGDASRTPAATLARWTAGGESPTSVGFDMRLEIAKGTPLAEHDLEMRLVVGGVGTDGRPRYRIIAVPFKAVVTSQWVTWWRWIWVGVSILAIAILVWVIVRFFNRRSMPQQLSPMLDDSPVVDLEDDGVRPMTRMPERSTKSGGPTASQSAEAGAATADESDSWSSSAGLGDATGMLRPD